MTYEAAPSFNRVTYTAETVATRRIVSKWEEWKSDSEWREQLDYELRVFLAKNNAVAIDDVRFQTSLVFGWDEEKLAEGIHQMRLMTEWHAWCHAFPNVAPRHRKTVELFAQRRPIQRVCFVADISPLRADWGNE